MKNIRYLVFVLFIIFMQCTHDENEKLYIIFNNIEKKYDEIILKQFKLTNEKEILNVYLPYFLYEYDELVKKDNNIKSFFESLNLNEQPAQAYAFLLLWHRKLNNQKLNLEEVIHFVNDDNKGIKSCGNLKNINAVYNFKKLSKGQNVQLKFPVMISDGHSGMRSTVFYGCPILEWNFDTSKDIIINGEVINKYFKEASKEFYIQLKIKNMSRNDALYFFKEVGKNDTIEVSLNSYGVKL